MYDNRPRGNVHMSWPSVQSPDPLVIGFSKKWSACQGCLGPGHHWKHFSPSDGPGSLLASTQAGKHSGLRNEPRLPDGICSSLLHVWRPSGPQSRPASPQFCSWRQATLCWAGALRRHSGAEMVIWGTLSTLLKSCLFFFFPKCVCKLFTEIPPCQGFHFALVASKKQPWVFYTHSWDLHTQGIWLGWNPAG